MAGQTKAKLKKSDAESAEWIAVHRVVFPLDDDPSTLPLYVDWRQVASATGAPQSGTPQLAKHVITPTTRRSIQVPASQRLSLATLFNAFPAAYWRRWTDVTNVRLRLRVEGAARVEIYRSTTWGAFNLIASSEARSEEVIFDTPITGFGDGGWLWFEVEAAGDPAVITDAEWCVPAFGGYRAKNVSVAITTFNRPDDCVLQMSRFAAAPELMARIDQLMITDQGSKRVADAEGFAAGAAALGEKFRLITQGNLGGSGGFSRGMYEGIHRPDTDYVMLMDDDVVIEPEGILRAVNFADFTRTPTIVGGHMLNLFERAIMNSAGETVNRFEFHWRPASTDLEVIDFGARALRSIPEFHRRVDVDYNGWWMCLIPREVIEDIGLALPVFIKWDDVEYGLRASARGYSTVSLPGAAVWHEPWTEKVDLLGWQAYFHERNRYVAALMHSPYRRGGSVVRVSLATDIKHLLSMQYSVVGLRHQAIKDVLRGPKHLHEDLPTINQRVRALRAQFGDAKVIADIPSYPEVRRSKPLPRGKEATMPTTVFGFAARVVAVTLKNLAPSPTPATEERVETQVAAIDAEWWRLAADDSAMVSVADGTGVNVYRRDRRTFIGLLKESVALRLQMRRSWPTLQRQYRAAAPQYVSPAAWEETFRRSGGEL